MKHKLLILQEDPPLFSAVSNGDYALLTKLTAIGEDINQHRATDGFTPIFIAVSRNNVPMLKFLLNIGAAPGEKNNAGMTALDLALSSLDFNKELVKSLLEASGIDSIQEKFNYYELARTGIYNADVVSALRKYLDISNQNLIKSEIQPDFSDDEWSWSDDDAKEQLISVKQLFQEDPSAQKYYEHILVAGDSG